VFRPPASSETSSRLVEPSASVGPNVMPSKFVSGNAFSQSSVLDSGVKPSAAMLASPDTSLAAATSTAYSRDWNPAATPRNSRSSTSSVVSVHGSRSTTPLCAAGPKAGVVEVGWVR